MAAQVRTRRIAVREVNRAAKTMGITGAGRLLPGLDRPTLPRERVLLGKPICVCQPDQLRLARVPPSLHVIKKASNSAAFSAVPSRSYSSLISDPK